MWQKNETDFTSDLTQKFMPLSSDHRLNDQWTPKWLSMVAHLNTANLIQRLLLQPATARLVACHKSSQTCDKYKVPIWKIVLVVVVNFSMNGI